MPAGTWTPTNATRTNLLKSVYGDVTANNAFKVALVTSASNIGAASDNWAAVTGEVANANGYTTGGQVVSIGLAGTTSVAASLVANPVWTANGGNITARTAVLIHVASGKVVAYALLDSTPADVVATNGNTLTIDSDGTPSPVFTLN